jgi:hypothetical protein
MHFLSGWTSAPVTADVLSFEALSDAVGEFMALADGLVLVDALSDPGVSLP